MRALHVVLPLAAALAAFTQATAARALGFVGASPSLVEAAVAPDSTETVRWTRAQLTSEQSVFAVYTLIDTGARVDLGSEAWLDALDEATSPRILPPVTPAACDVPDHFDVVREGPEGSLARMTSAHAVATQGEANVLLGNLGLAQTIQLSPEAQAELAAGKKLLLLAYQAQPGVVRLPTLRIQERPQGLPVFRLAGPQADTKSLLKLFTLGVEHVVPAHAHTLPLSLVSWSPAGSDYAAARSRWLSLSPGTFAVESVGHSSLYFETEVPGYPSKIRPALARYFALAKAQGAPMLDDGACFAEVTRARSAGSPVGASCGAGEVYAGTGAPCSEPAQGAFDPKLLRCAGTDDAALFLSGLVPSRTSLVRSVASLGGLTERTSLLRSDRGPKAPWSRASSTMCESPKDPAGVTALPSAAGASYPTPAPSNDLEVDTAPPAESCDGSGVLLFADVVASSESCDSGGTGGSSGSSGTIDDSEDWGSSDDSSDGESYDDGDTDEGDDDSYDYEDSDEGDDESRAKAKSRGAREKATPAGVNKLSRTRSPLSRGMLLLALVALPLRRWTRRKATTE